MTTYWITKYALTIGIKPLDGAEPCEGRYLSKDGNVSAVDWDEQRHFYFRSEWHVSKTAAIAKAEQMRVAKIASLKKQIAKLEKMKF